MPRRRKIPLGAKVSFTARACSERGGCFRFIDDRNSHFVRQFMIDHNIPSSPNRRQIIRWPEQGEGVVVGTKNMQEGNVFNDDINFVSVERAPMFYKVRDRHNQKHAYLVPENEIEWIENDRRFRFPVDRDDE